MDPKEMERIAICRVLLDVLEDMNELISVTDCRHYPSLKDKTGVTDEDFDTARDFSVLSSLVILKGMHYNQKMLLALTVCDLYSELIAIPLSHRMAFDTLMHAIEWPISFSEMLTLSRLE